MRSSLTKCRLLSILALLAAGLCAAVPARADDDERLVCIGALAGAHIYTTYGYIGGVADLYAADEYKADRVQELMKEVVGLADVSVRELRKVRDGQIIETDKKVIDDVIEVYALLQKEATSLSDYTRTKSQEDLDKYEAARTAVWPRIKTVLGIKDADEAEANK